MLFLTGCGLKNKNGEESPIKSSSECDVAYRDICKVYELKTKNIMNLLKTNKITPEQAEIMFANEYNWAATATAERYYLINRQTPARNYNTSDADIEMLQSMRQGLSPNGRHPRGWRAFMDGMIRGLEYGVKTQQ